MTEALRRAFELAQQQPEEEQEVIAQLIFEEFAAEERWNELLAHPKSAILLEQMAERWNELLAHPKSAILLEQMAEQARKEYATGLTHTIGELL